jgi:hypothetical protein
LVGLGTPKLVGWLWCCGWAFNNRLAGGVVGSRPEKVPEEPVGSMACRWTLFGHSARASRGREARGTKPGHLPEDAYWAAIATLLADNNGFVKAIRDDLKQRSDEVKDRLKSLTDIVAFLKVATEATRLAAALARLAAVRASGVCAGWSSAPSLGSISSGDCACATNAEPTSIRPSSHSAARSSASGRWGTHTIRGSQFYGSQTSTPPHHIILNLSLSVPAHYWVSNCILATLHCEPTD